MHFTETFVNKHRRTYQIIRDHAKGSKVVDAKLQALDAAAFAAWQAGAKTKVKSMEIDTQRTFFCGAVVKLAWIF